MLDLKDLRIFLKVAELGSLSGAASALRVPKSTASRALARLEERVGSPLLRRSARRLGPTETGVLLQRHALRILGEVELAETAVSRVRGAPRGLLRVTAPFTFGRAFVAPLLPEFLARHPEIRVALELTPGGVEPVGSEVDVAVRLGPLDGSSLRARKLGRATLWLCASPRYLAGRKAPRQATDLEDHDVLDWSGPDGERGWTLFGPDRAETVRVTPRLTVNDASVLRVAALAGTGVAWLPDFLCHADLEAGRLRRLLPGWRRDEPEIHALFPGGRALSPKVRAFVDFLVERLEIRALETGEGAGHGAAFTPLAEDRVG
ncbi:MAG TPA: LysR family transcriptional regulator [Myxococcota bacterium]|nr:LysR family transcriptional regulator [Myxococcota bacterium]